MKARDDAERAAAGARRQAGEGEGAGGDLHAAYLTHELRAPATAIRLALEILREQASLALDASQRQTLVVAIKNTERLDGLISDILDFHRLAAGKLTATREACDLQAVAAEAVESQDATAKARGVRLATAFPEGMPRAFADPRRVAQVLVNLICNAIKNTPAGGSVTVSASAGCGPNAGFWVLQVTDTGCGIPAGDTERIFQAFEQSALTGKKQGSGTGLGLTIARGMVRAHGGRIWAESPGPGRGASFFFTIPAFGVEVSTEAAVQAAPTRWWMRCAARIERVQALGAAVLAAVVLAVLAAIQQRGNP